ncbi:MAG: EAL domain-containing protein [Campylobacterales bacterium]|nr:EAL domain-containing protein [Campylobacterales bacterium]
MRSSEPRSIQSLWLAPLRRYGSYALIALALFGALSLTAHTLFLSMQRTLFETLESEHHTALSATIGALISERLDALKQQLVAHSAAFGALKPQKLSDETALWQEHAGFFWRLDENRSVADEPYVFGYNLLRLQPGDVYQLGRLHTLLPTVRALVEENDDLVRSAWIYIDRRYALHYPALSVAKVLSPEYDVTEEPIYYQLGPLHNPDREIRFLGHDAQPWSVDAGEFATVSAPLYTGDVFAGVVGLALNVRGLGAMLERLTLPSGIYVQLLDDQGYLLAASDEIQSRHDWGVASWYAQMGAQEERPQLHRLFGGSDAPKRVVYELEGGALQVAIVVRPAPKGTIDEQAVLILLWAGLMLLMVLLYIALRRRQQEALQSVNEALHTLTCKPSSGIIECDALAIRWSQECARLLRDDVTALGNAAALQEVLEGEGYLMLFELGTYDTVMRHYGKEAAETLLHCAEEVLQQQSPLKGYRIAQNRFALFGKAAPERFGAAFESLKRVSCRCASLQMQLRPVGVLATQTPLYERALAVLDVAKARQSEELITCKAADQIATLCARRLSDAEALHKALESGEVALFLQGIYDADKGAIGRFEASMRLDSRTLLRPFTAVAESGDLMRLAIRKLFALAVRYRAYGFEIGLEPDDVADEALCLYIHEQALAYALSPAQITFVLRAESLCESDAQRLEGLSLLKREGFRLSLDDIDLGCVPLSVPGRIGCDELKLSADLIARLPGDAQAAGTLRFWTRTALVWGASCVAKGVHTQELIDLLRDHRIAWLQGDAIAPVTDAQTALDREVGDDEVS